MSLYDVEAVVLYFAAAVGLEVVELVEDWDVPDLGEGGGVCLGDVGLNCALLLLRWQNCPYIGNRPELVQDVDALLRVVALMRVPEGARLEIEHHIAHLIVGPLLIHLYDAVDGRVQEVLVLMNL